MTEQQLARAAEECAKALKQGPQPDLLAALADYLEQLDFKHEALEKLFELHTLQPRREDLKPQLVRLALAAGRPDVAAPLISDFPAVLSTLQDSPDPTLRFGYAYLLYHCRNYREAAAQFRQLLRVNEWSIWAHSMAGLCHYQLGELEPSLHYFDQGLQRIRPEDRFEYRELYFNRACVLYVHGQLLPTLSSLEQLWGIDPHYPEVRDWIDEVRAHLRRGDDGPQSTAALKPRPRPPGFRKANP